MGTLFSFKSKVKIRLWLSLAYFAIFCPIPSWTHLNLVKECGEIICQEHEFCRRTDHICDQCSSVCTIGRNFQRDICENDCQDYLHDERYIRTGGNSSGGNLQELYENLQKDVLVLKVLVGVSILVILVTIAAFIAFVIYFWRFIHTKSPKSRGTTTTKEVKKTKSVEMPTIYNNKYRVDSPVSTGRNDLNSNEGGVNHHESADNFNHSSASSNTNNRDSDESTRPSPTKSENSSVLTNPTMSTLVNNSLNSHSTNRFRREPSESTIPEYINYDNTSMGPGIVPYSQHV